ncbi:hypothetical protein [Deminuibacter soli]|uniref:ABC transporter ATPase n=1 Tax=Deminuibacter soli TaxID=2291815 RepID=A0A3E1NJF3_9BACT|nr:hypothetical protein [Deminuibacter soli]RFM28066.1 hypothetical protein DXN05_11060 [Deminuibacter soli]
MNFEYSHHIPTDFDHSSRVWIYQSSRLFTFQEVLQLEPMLEAFAAQWKSHGAQVKAYANLLFGQFIVLMADETQAGVSGCSTDSSVRFIKQVEDTFKVDMFNRQMLAFVVKDKLQLLPLSQLEYALQNGFVTGETLYFNNLAATKEELLNNWLVPAGKSWLATRYPALKQVESR